MSFSKERARGCFKRNELRINRYVNRNGKKRKHKFRLEVDNRQLSEDLVAELLHSGYVIEDQERPIYKHIPELMKKMGLKG